MIRTHTTTPEMLAYQGEAEWRHVANGLDSLETDQIPDVPIEIDEGPDGVRSRYRVYGNLLTADSLVVVPLNYSTQIDDESVQVGLHHKQATLGDGYAVIGAELFSATAHLNGYDDLKVAASDFRVFATRLDGVIEKLQPSDEQRLFVHGYSFGADVNAEYASLNTLDPNFGNHHIERHGIFDPARSNPRTEQALIGEATTVRSFMTSGGDLYDNIVDSRTPALLEANQIDPDQHFAKLRFNARIGAGILRYVKANRRDNLALIEGLSTARTVSLINELSDRRFMTDRTGQPEPELPQLVLGETAHGIARGFLAHLRPSPNQTRYYIEGDHSVADYLPTGSALVLATVGSETLVA